MRLRHLYTGELTRRELLVLVRGLPPTSRLRVAMDGGRAPWTAEQYQLADLYDLLAGANWQRANQGAKTPGPRPKPYPRPVTAADRAREAALEARRAAALQRAATHAFAIEAGRAS